MHRTHLPGKTMEGDFAQTVGRIAGKVTRVCDFVAALPARNAYAAKAFPVERLECLLDGINHAFEVCRDLTDRIVLDNTSLTVRRVLRGADRERCPRCAFPRRGLRPGRTRRLQRDPGRR